MSFKDNVDLVNPDSDHMDSVNADNQDLEVESHTSDDSPSSFSSKCNSFAYKTTRDHSQPLFEWQANLSNTRHTATFTHTCKYHSLLFHKCI